MRWLRKMIFCVFFVVILVSCKKEEVKMTQICILIDVTDERFKNENFSNENLSKFLELMKLDKQTGGFSGGEIKLSLINAVSDSKSHTVRIEKGEQGLMGDNPLNRKDEVLKFYSELENSFSKILSSANWGTKSSKIYQKFARESIRMKRNDTPRKFIIIYSDMLENSDLFSLYTNNWQKELEKMKNSPEETLTQFSKKGPALPDLSEFTIYIITTRNSENDQKINIAEQFWTSLLEYKGATVLFNSTLEI